MFGVAASVQIEIEKIRREIYMSFAHNEMMTGHGFLDSLNDGREVWRPQVPSATLS